MNLALNPVSHILTVSRDNGSWFRVCVSNETHNPALGRRSLTFKWEDDGKKYRVQIQVTE